MDEIKTSGVVLKRTFVGENDAIIKILTTELGLVSASVKGIKSMKSKLKAGSTVFSYSDFLLKPKGEIYIMSQAVQKEGFYGLASNIERLSYASYFADLLVNLSPSKEDAKDLIPLLLNAFYLLSNTSKSMDIIKCVFELKVLSHLGYAPELSECIFCGEENKLMFFSAKEGGCVCTLCGAKSDTSIISENALLAMRYALSSDDKKAFSFTLPREAKDEFEKACENMIEAVLSRRLSSLTYLKQITGKI